MTNFLRVKKMDVKCSVIAMGVFVLFSVLSLLLNVVLFVKEGFCF